MPTVEGAPERPRDLLVAGHVNVDRFLKVAAFPAPDRTVPVVDQSVALGGTAANLARVATSLGVATGLVARVGAEFPAAFRRQLVREGVDVRGLEAVSGCSSPTCYIVVDGRGRQRTLIDQGPMRDARGARTPGPWLREYAWLHVTTGDPRFALALSSRAIALGMKVAADPAQEIFYRWDAAKLKRLLRNAEILFGNRAEIEHAAGLVGGGGPHGLLERVPIVIRTEGPDGATAFRRGGAVHVAARRPRNVRSYVGGGDAFRGGFYCAWFHGVPLRGCLEAGTRAAARWIERGLPTARGSTSARSGRP